MPGTINIRCYEELNDFLPVKKRKTIFSHTFSGNMSVKDIIESLGVPHTEIDLILINGEPVEFYAKPENGDFVSAYPVFESIDISSVSKLRPEPLRNPCFILDVHLGKLAKYLRMLGFDSLYQNNFDDKEIIEISLKEKRIILTRDLGILKNGKVTHGYWVRSQKPKEQVNEVVKRFDLTKQIEPLNRCIECNGNIVKIEKDKIADLLKPKTRKYFHEFFQCTNCKKVYWEGSHYLKMLGKIEMISNEITKHQ
jgi:uncharacterized protein with PIN domain